MMERWDLHRHRMAQGVNVDTLGFVRCECAWFPKPHYKALPKPHDERVEWLTSVLTSKAFADWLRILMAADIDDKQTVAPDFARDMAGSIVASLEVVLAT